MRVLVLINPKAAQASMVLEDLAAWFKESCEASIVPTRSRHHLTQTISRDGQDFDRIVICGGDGTISDALPELLRLGKPLAVLPVGTANDFARCLGLPQDWAAAADIALRGRSHEVDVGLVNARPFLNVASVGVAVDVSRAQSADLKRSFRVLSYLIGLLRVAGRSRPFHVELSIDEDRSWSGFVYQVSIANGRFHGGGLTVAEEAVIDDQMLNVYFVLPGRFWQLVACITHLKFGLIKPDVLRQLSGRRVTINTRKPRLINADGEIGTETPAKFSLLPKALSVMVPQDLADAPGLTGAQEI